MTTSFPLKFPDGQRLAQDQLDPDTGAVGQVMTIVTDTFGNKVSKWSAGISGSAGARTTTLLTTGALTSGGRETGLLTLAKGTAVVRVRELTGKTCRLRLYSSTAHRTADLARSRSTSAVSGSSGTGCLLDVLLSANESWDLLLSPPAIVDDATSPPTTSIPYTVDNLSDALLVLRLQIHHTILEG